MIGPGALVVGGERKPAARDVLRRISRERGARFLDADAGTDVARPPAGRAGREVERLTTPRGRPRSADDGAARASSGAQRRRGGAPAGRARRGRIHGPRRRDRAGAGTDVRWPGRLDLRERGPRAAACSSTRPTTSPRPPRSATTCGRSRRQGVPLVFGALRDKDAAGMVRALGRAAISRFVCAPAGNSPRERPASGAGGDRPPRPAGDRPSSAAAAPARGARGSLGGTARWRAPRGRSTWSGRSSTDLDPVPARRLTPDAGLVRTRGRSRTPASNRGCGRCLEDAARAWIDDAAEGAWSECSRGCGHAAMAPVANQEISILMLSLCVPVTLEVGLYMSYSSMDIGNAQDAQAAAGMMQISPHGLPAVRA